MCHSKRSKVIWLAMLCAASIRVPIANAVDSNPSASPAPQEPYWHLFLDDHSITRSTGFQRVVHQPKPRGIILEGSRPWDQSRGVTPLYVGRRKQGGYEMYYRAHGNLGSVPAYAISEDGLRWEKPDLHLVDTPWGKANNLLPCKHPRDMFVHGNVRDPAKRFAFCMDSRVKNGIYFTSETPDFVNDPQAVDKLNDSGGYLGSNHNSLEFWDDINNEWVAMRQAPNHGPVRCAGRYASPDLLKWRLNHYLYPDAHDSTDPRYFDEVYGLMSIHREGFVLGFAYWFIGDRTHPDPKFYKSFGRHTTDEGLIGKGVSRGTMEVRLVVSRDGCKTWDRTVSREAWIPHGKEQDSYDRVVRIDCPPVYRNDEDWFYCSGYDGDHAQEFYHERPTNNIYGTLYTQKHNRYVSLRAGNVGQILITKPIEVTGKTLQLNVDASHGEVTVAVGIDKWMRHKTGQWKFEANLPHWMVRDRWERSHLEKGFQFEDCIPIRDDSTRKEVKFTDANFESLLGKTVRLYIRVQDANLYGFRFR